MSTIENDGRKVNINIRLHDATTRDLWTALISTMAETLQVPTSMILQTG